jgi:hypothetical protein
MSPDPPLTANRPLQAPRKQVISMSAKRVKPQPNTAVVKPQPPTKPASLLPAITGHGHTKDGRTLYTVASRSHPGHFHLVTAKDERVTCDCEAAQYGKMCSHRAVVSAHLEAHEPIVATTDWYRDTAPLYRDNLPFSVFKH